MSSLTFEGKRETVNIKVDELQGKWLSRMLGIISVQNKNMLTLQQVKDDYEAAGLVDFELFWDNKPVNTLYKIGLLHL